MKTVAMLIFIFTSLSKAGIFLEPYVGYGTGKIESEQTSASIIENDITGIGYGARLGITLGGYLFFAGDALLVKGDYKNNSMTQKQDMESLLYSGIAGLRFWGIRVWYGQIFKVDTELESSGVSQEYEGDGWKAGLGKIFFGKFSLNAEYIFTEFDSIDGIDFPSSNIQNSEHSFYLITIGFPI